MKNFYERINFLIISRAVLPLQFCKAGIRNIDAKQLHLYHQITTTHLMGGAQRYNIFPNEIFLFLM